MTMRFLHGATLDELQSAAAELKLPKFRAKQLAQWLYGKMALDAADMANLPKDMTETLKREFILPPVRETAREESPDSVVKLALELFDGEIIEMAVIPMEERTTLCLSTQAGCAVGCRFCASGCKGLRRNLKCAEMLGEFAAGCRLLKKKCDNIVFMGIGEGLMNFAELSAALDALTRPEPDGYNMSPRRITVSTSGFVPGMREFAKLKKEYNLAISLHAPDDETRAKLIPDNCRYSIAEILQEADLIRESNHRDYTLEYTLVSGINDAPAQAEALGKLAYLHHAKVNLIPYNPTSAAPEFRRPAKAVIEEFHRQVSATGCRVTRRVERGRSKTAACGQLRLRKEFSCTEETDASR